MDKIECDIYWLSVVKMVICFINDRMQRNHLCFMVSFKKKCVQMTMPIQDIWREFSMKCWRIAMMLDILCALYVCAHICSQTIAFGDFKA